MNRLSEGYKRVVDKIWSRKAKIRFLGPKPGFQAQTKINIHFLMDTMLCKEKSNLFPNKYQTFSGFLVFFLKKKTNFRQNVEMAVSP